MKSSIKRKIIIGIILIIQTIIFIFIGLNKQYIHMDEAYSFGLASYKQTEIQNNEDFYNEWHSKDYYEDYISLQKEEVLNYKPVYENQKNDVHPPFYYLLLRFFMNISIGHFSVWPGIILNIIIYIFITLFMYFIIKKLLKKEKNTETKAFIIAFISSVTLASLTNAIYIRMYALSTLNILITCYLHMLLIDNKNDKRIFIGIGISALIGSLTHYYYLFFLFMLFVLICIKFIKKKNFIALRWYLISIIIAAVLSLMIFPFSIQHMFFGYRGEGVIGNILNTPLLLKNIFAYLEKLDFYGFNCFLIIIIFVIIFCIIYKKRKKVKVKKNEYLKFLTLPVIFYFVITSIASPWIELRYILPVCGLIFVLVIYYLYELLGSVIDEKKRNIIIASIICSILINPIIFKLEPQELFRDKKEIVQTLKTELNLPTIYAFNSNNNRFLDDILLFSKINESYIAKDMDLSNKSIQSIMKDKDLSKGMILFINEGQEHNDVIESFQESLKLKKVEHLKRLNACNVYYLY